MTFTATAPPTVWDYKDLLAFIEKFDDAVWVSIDKKGVDHLKKEKPGMSAPSNYDKLSEVGVATYDPREKVSTSTTNDIEALGSCIGAYHTIVHEFRGVTEETCTA